MTGASSAGEGRDLVRDVDLLCLDAGNTVIFLDHARLAEILRGFGLDASVETLIRTEGEAKRLAETGALVDVAWSFREKPGALGWGRTVATIVLRAGLEPEKLAPMLEATWRIHTSKNLWRRVPTGLGEALSALRGAGVKTAIVSNSEGMLDALFRQLGVRDHFDAIVDSGLVGVEKPDPRIFRIALETFGVAPARALHLGDIFATDILGARAAGLRSALIDPHGHYAGAHLEVPRVPDVASVARAITAARREPSSGGSR